ncbi:MAG: hypothetical protein QM764_10310 [Chitinophagaceae bacterium]
MRFYFLFFITSLCVLSGAAAFATNNWSSPLPAASDTTIISHATDGNTTEWPATKFENDVSTDISYAVDNDKDNLYLALIVPNEGIQMKLSKMGMKLFIDLKGKKKESRGISFPVKDESATAAGSTDYNKAAGITSSDDTRPDEPRKPVDKKLLRSQAAIRMNYMNVFGFDDGTHDQGLKMPGSINIAFTWDTADIMHIEYVIPLKMLGTAEELNLKDISIGWRVNGMYPSDKYAQGMDRPRGRNKATAAYGNGATGFDPSRKIITRETIIRENNFWTHYLIKE